jgi:hypothetical protein
MEAEFWLERWDKNEIGFHLPTVNPLLAEHWPQLHLPTGTRVLVPLAGKTVDLSWLRAQGHAVVAVELSEHAAQAFYTQAGLTPSREQDGAFIRYHADGIDYLVGDFFSLDAVTLGEFGAVSVVSGKIRGQTNTIPLHIEALYDDYNFTGAFAVASLLAFLALITLGLKTWVDYKNATQNETEISK